MTVFQRKASPTGGADAAAPAAAADAAKASVTSSNAKLPPDATASAKASKKGKKGSSKALAAGADDKQVEIDPSVLPRRFEILKTNEGFPSNKASTGRYTPLNCFPLFVVELFHPIENLPNIYYLVIGLMQMIPSISPAYPLSRYSAIGFPITWFNLGIMHVQETVERLVEDSAKHRADRRTNAQKVAILRDGKFDEEGTWGEVKVGDVLKIHDRGCFPADLLLLRGADPMAGQAWVNTKPLDGESDTKLRLAPKVTVELLDDPDAANVTEKLKGCMFAEGPNDKVNDFMGQLRLEGQPPVFVNQQNLLLRGCQLRLSDWVIGLVVSTGKHTKIDYSTGHPPRPKVSNVVQRLRKHVLGILVLLISWSVLGALMSLVFEKPEFFWYLGRDCEGAKDCQHTLLWFQTWGAHILLIYLFIPTTLIVSLPFIQLFQCGFMTQDLDMYDESVDEPCHIGNPRLCDELGQISHIFSDKTGTLTAHHMEFRRFFVGGTSYGCGDTAVSRSLRGKNPKPRLRTPPEYAQCRPFSAPFVGFEEASDVPSIFHVLEAGGPAAAEAHEFFLAMAINHSVMIEEVNSELELAASSPDEQAFVAAAEYFGFEFLSRDTFGGIVRLRQRSNDTEHLVKLLEVFPYESSRKRMSVLVELPEALLELVGGGCATRLYVKGADSMMLTLLEPGSKGADPESLATLEALLIEWAEVALRTLVWGKREVSEYSAWAAEYQVVFANPEEQRKLKAGEPNRISELELQMDAGLTLQGASAIEDKLQDEVPETLHDLRAAGIKVWMLTGDKVGTAMNIARACNILPRDSEIFEMTADTFTVLNELSTAEMMEVQRDLTETTSPSVRAGKRALVRSIHRTVGAAQQKSGGAASAAAATSGLHWPRWLSPRRLAGEWGSKQEPVPSLADVSSRSLRMTPAEEAYEARVAMHIEALDKKHPQLAMVREALARQLEHIVTRMNNTSVEPSMETEHTETPRDLELATVPSSMTLNGTADPGTPTATRNASILTRPGAKRGPDMCLVLDEKAIEYCSTLCKPMLTAVANACRSVVACRARKDQKAQMVNMIREGVTGSCCLAIGDGANDVAMIRAAHVGVGIIGKEGREALNASDFGIGQFRFLRHLLLVHGRNNYRRLAMFILFTFYKNIVNALTMWYYSMLGMASGHLLWPSIIADFLAPAAFTMLPILMYPLFDRDVPNEVAARSPELYTPGIARAYYTTWRLIGWVTEATYAAMICAYGTAYALRNTPFDTVSSASIALATLWTCSWTAYARLSFEITSWSVVEVCSLLLMIALLGMMTPIMSILNGPVPNNENAGFSWSPINGTGFINLSDPTFWLTLIMVVAAANLPKLIATAIKIMNHGSHRLWQVHLGLAHKQGKAVQEKLMLKELQVPRPSMASTAHSTMRSELDRTFVEFSEVVKRNAGIAQDDISTQHLWENLNVNTSGDGIRPRTRGPELNRDKDLSAIPSGQQVQHL